MTNCLNVAIRDSGEADEGATESESAMPELTVPKIARA